MDNNIKFNPDLFVDRELERELVNNLLTEKETELRILEFSGITGQGKTELLKWAYTEAKTKKLLSAYIDFELSEFHRKEIYPILETIAAQLSSDEHVKTLFDPFVRTLPNYIDEFNRYYRSLWEEPRIADRKPLIKLEKELIEKFNTGIRQLLSSCKLVLCLDSTDKAYEIAIREFEQQFLQNFADNPNFIILVAGQQKFDWMKPHLQERVSRRQLKRFEYEDVRKFLDRYDKIKQLNIEDREQLLRQIWNVTLGHPFSSYKFLDIISNGFKKNLTKEVVSTVYPESVKLLIKNVITDRMLSNLGIGENYPLPEKILFYLAPFRRIEFVTLWFALTTFLRDWFKNKPFIFFEELLEEFHKHSHVFTPWKLGQGFNMEEVTRSILLSDLRINNYEQFVEIQKILADQYDIWVSQTRDASQVKNIVEKFYHHTMLLKETCPDNAGDIIKKELERYLDLYFTLEFIPDEVRLHEQLDRLAKDLKSDGELSDMTDIHALSDIIEKRMK
ncbi:MAG: hypothetical protein GY795_35615 [Desulfobacterales bacterium]|nr:hypothetical protein [Desulfobacterales bacterium]